MKEGYKTFFSKRKLVTAVLFVVVIFAVAVPAHTQAGVFDYVASLFKGSDKVADSYKSTFNSQNMPLLEAPLNSKNEASIGGGSVDIVDGRALLASNSVQSGDKVVPKNGQINVYVVKEGDSLSQVAEMFGVSPSTIIWANDIKRDDIIQTGQKLVILPITGIRYVIEKGDTFSSIAEGFEGDIEEIKQYNGVYEDSQLAVGETLIIPNGEIAGSQESGRDHDYKATPSPSYSGPVYAGYYMRPISGGVRTQGLHGYNAVDLAAPIGTPIMASASGTVIISKGSGWNGGYGAYIVIEHNNGTQTLYSHNSENIVSVGQNVVQGQVIGYIGSTGRSTGPHVHFEVRGAQNPF